MISMATPDREVIPDSMAMAIAITEAQKQALLDNLQLEGTRAHAGSIGVLTVNSDRASPQASRTVFATGPGPPDAPRTARE